MTKNRAQKHAARRRAAITGERYVVARRSAAEPPRTGRVHELMHRIAGVPLHVEGGLQGARTRSGAKSKRPNRTHGQPRVLVRWQNWIARRVGVGGQ